MVRLMPSGELFTGAYKKQAPKDDSTLCDLPGFRRHHLIMELRSRSIQPQTFLRYSVIHCQTCKRTPFKKSCNDPDERSCA